MPSKATAAAPAAVTSALFARIYRELHAIARQCMRGERQQHTLQATALVHEAFLHLVRARDQAWAEPTHLLAVAARAIRRVLVNHAVGKRCVRRGSGRRPQPLGEAASAPTGLAPLELIALGEALDALDQLDPRQARLVELRFFGGLSTPEIARVLGVSPRTVDSEWSLARAWLRCHMARADDA